MFETSGIGLAEPTAPVGGMNAAAGKDVLSCHETRAAAALAKQHLEPGVPLADKHKACRLPRTRRPISWLWGEKAVHAHTLPILIGITQNSRK